MLISKIRGKPLYLTIVKVILKKLIISCNYLKFIKIGSPEDTHVTGLSSLNIKQSLENELNQMLSYDISNLMFNRNRESIKTTEKIDENYKEGIETYKSH